MKSFIGYHRVSTSKQGADGYGMEAQRQTVKTFVSSQQGELIACFDEVESGANNARPQLAAAIEMSKARRAVLVIAKLDRISRNAAFLLQLQDSGVDFVATDMPSADRFTVSILACVAQRERELISQRTKAGLRVAQERGVKLGSPKILEARIAGQIVIKERKTAFAASATKIIKEIQSTGVNSLNKLADCLNKRGEKTARGKRWNAMAVKRVLECATP
jgi:DNA invertase Pin-like site-specific DNA recombinase